MTRHRRVRTGGDGARLPDPLHARRSLAEDDPRGPRCAVWRQSNSLCRAGPERRRSDAASAAIRFEPDAFKRNRTLIAFVPPTEDTEKRNAEAMEIYARYGVSVVYFGQWTAETTADNDRSYWLHWVYQDAKTLSTTLKTLAGPLANEPLQKAIGTECPKLTRLFDDNCRTAGDEFKKQFFAEATHHLFDSDGQACDIRLPLNLLITIRDQVLEKSGEKKEPLRATNFLPKPAAMSCNPPRSARSTPFCPLLFRRNSQGPPSDGATGGSGGRSRPQIARTASLTRSPSLTSRTVHPTNGRAIISTTPLRERQ